MFSFPSNSTVPTAEQVLVPETLLKKRKSNEKAAAEAATKKAELKKVNFKA
jgi:large subunit ribosomal protein L7e